MRPFLFAVPLAVAALLRGGSARADEGAAPRVVVEDRGPNRMLLATGGATLAFSYGVSGWVGATSSRESERFLLVPVLGPWAALVKREPCVETVAVVCDSESTFEALLVTSGALQLAGIAQIAFAFVTRERREVERPVFVPVAMRGGAGFGAVAVF